MFEIIITLFNYFAFVVRICCYTGIVMLLTPFLGLYTLDALLYSFRVFNYLLRCYFYRQQRMSDRKSPESSIERKSSMVRNFRPRSKYENSRKSLEMGDAVIEKIRIWLTLNQQATTTSKEYSSFALNSESNINTTERNIYDNEDNSLRYVRSNETTRSIDHINITKVDLIST